MLDTLEGLCEALVAGWPAWRRLQAAAAGGGGRQQRPAAHDPQNHVFFTCVLNKILTLLCVFIELSQQVGVSLDVVVKSSNFTKCF